MPLLAQPIVGPEVVTPPLAAFGGASIAPIRDGYVIAWSEGGRIRAGHLDSTLHLTGTLLELPLYQFAGSARHPSVATIGTSVLVAWEETGPSFDGTIIASLSPDVRELIHGPRLLAIAKDEPPVVYAGKGTYSVVQGVVVYTVSESLDAGALSSFPNATSVIVSPIGMVASYVGYQYSSPCADWLCTKFATIRVETPTSEYFLHDQYDGYASLFPLPEAPHLSATGDALIVTWRSTTLRSVIIHADGSTALWPFGNLDAPSPVITGNGPAALAVWHGTPSWSSATLYGGVHSE